MLRAVGIIDGKPAFALPDGSLVGHSSVGAWCDDPEMNLFDAFNFADLLPRSVRRALATALVAGIAYAPPVRDWYFDQAQRHAHEITDVLLRTLPEGQSTSPASAR